MGLSIINNIAALGAQRALSSASTSLGSSLARLSSGLRINSAKDDPSGLAISERFRTQIRGLTRASSNAQDAISFLQTAEGALNETHSILQRMRELAVQAANGILTSSDRLEIQKEVDQLSEEINRIASSTEFNTKKLLDGSSAALWSADSSDIRAVITGLVAEGNYRLDKNSIPTVDHVIKTDIFQVKAAAQGVTNLELNDSAAYWSDTGVEAINGGAQGLVFNFGSGDVTVAVTTVALDTLDVVAGKIAVAINGDSNVNTNVMATVDGIGGITITSLVTGTSSNTWTMREATGNTDSLLVTAIATAAVPTTLGVDTASGITAIDNPQNLPAGTGYTIEVDENATVAADTAGLVRGYSQTGSTIDWSTLDAPGHTITTDDSGYLIIEVTATSSGAQLLTDGDTYVGASIDNGQTWYSFAGSDIEGAGGGTGISIGGTVIDTDFTDATVQVGDKVLIAYYGDTTAANETLQVTVPDNGVGPQISYADGDLLNTTTTVDVASMDSSGNITFGTLDVTFGASLADGTATFDITAAGGIAQGSTALYYVDRSYDNVGNFIFGDSGQYLTIYNALGDKTSVFIDGADTLQEVADKIENAIIGDKSSGGLGMSAGTSDVDDHVADFISTATANTDESVKGTIVIRSPKQGLNGKLFFSASEDVLKFFSFADIQDPREEIDPLTVTVYNAHTGELVGSDTVSDNVLRNVIAGVEVRIDSNVDVDVAWNSATRSFDFTSSAGVETEYLHIVDSSVTFQIGANKGQITKSYIAQMDGEALGTNNVLVINQEVAQLAIEQVDSAINQVSSERARIGGNISRLEHTINNLSVQAENAVAAESRIRDLDMALEMTEFTKQQLLLQASTAMLAQANQVPQILLQLLR